MSQWRPGPERLTTLCSTPSGTLRRAWPGADVIVDAVVIPNDCIDYDVCPNGCCRNQPSEWVCCLTDTPDIICAVDGDACYTPVPKKALSN